MNLDKAHLPHVKKYISPIDISRSAMEEYAFYGDRRISVVADIYWKVSGFTERSIDRFLPRKIEVALYKSCR